MREGNYKYFLSLFVQSNIIESLCLQCQLDNLKNNVYNFLHELLLKYFYLSFFIIIYMVLRLFLFVFYSSWLNSNNYQQI